MHLPGRWTVVSSKYFLLSQKVSTPRKYHPCNSTWGQLHCECRHHFVMYGRLYSGGSKHIYMQGKVLSALFYFAGSVEFKSLPLALTSFWLLIAHNKKCKACPVKYNIYAFLFASKHVIDFQNWKLMLSSVKTNAVL